MIEFSTPRLWRPPWRRASNQYWTQASQVNVVSLLPSSSTRSLVCTRQDSDMPRSGGYKVE